MHRGAPPPPALDPEAPAPPPGGGRAGEQDQPRPAAATRKRPLPEHGAEGEDGERGGGGGGGAEDGRLLSPGSRRRRRLGERGESGGGGVPSEEEQEDGKEEEEEDDDDNVTCARGSPAGRAAGPAGFPREEEQEQEEEEEEEQEGEEGNSAAAGEPAPAPGLPSPALEDWRTCWDDATGNWYFYSLTTGETTWENPYPAEPAAAAAAGAPAREPRQYQQQWQRPHEPPRHPYEGWGGAPETPAGPDPLRELLDRTDRVRAALGAPPDEEEGREEEGKEEESPAAPPSPSPWADDPAGPFPSGAGAPDYTFRALFNKRTGKFQPAESYLGDPRERFSQISKAERQCGIYFDYKSWVECRADSSPSADRRKADSRPKTKKEIETYKARKRERKMMKQRAWLAD